MLKVHLDPNNHNGAVFLGLNGVVVKSHGSADAKGVANAVHVAAKLLRENITQRITEDLDNFRAHFPSESPASCRVAPPCLERVRPCPRPVYPIRNWRKEINRATKATLDPPDISPST